MLDDYKIEQPIAYKMLKNTIKKNRFSHAYIIETNGTYKALDFSISFAKYLFCPNNYTNNLKCLNCNQCKQIDNNNYLELKIINPDGIWIKKDQLKQLEDEFRNKSMLGNKKIYIINHADQMNVSASNTILKFLEEPEENIFAILIVDNIFNLLPTIISRCQVIKLQNKENNFFDNIISQEEMDLKIQNCINFINYFEKNKLDTICKINNLWLKNFKDKEQNLLAFDIIMNIYRGVLDYKLNINNETLKKYEEIISYIANINTISNICDKIKVIFEIREKIKMNANIALQLDKLIISLERIK